MKSIENSGAIGAQTHFCCALSFLCRFTPDQTTATTREGL
jgi:hypothetical protein